MLLFSPNCTDDVEIDDSIHAPPLLCDKGAVSIPWTIVRFASSGGSRVRFWILPPSLCPPHSLIVSAASQLDASNEIGSSICLFTQPDATRFRLSLSARPSTDLTIDFHGRSPTALRPCGGDQSCEFRSIRPFFVSIRTNRSFSMHLLYCVSGAKTALCALRRVGALRLPNTFGDTVSCTSAADETMNTAVSLLLMALVTASVLCVIHCMGVVNLFRIIGCGLGSRAFAETDYLTLTT
jgi:hypothetical protein